MELAELQEIKAAIERYHASSAEATLKVIEAYEQLRRDADMWTRMAWNEGVLRTRERVCQELMPKYGRDFGNAVWSITVDDPFAPVRREEKSNG